MIKRLLSGSAILLLTSSMGWAQTLNTESYQIEVTSLCPEGEVMCQEMQFELTLKESGEVLHYSGRTLSRLCADGETPCQFIGYRFGDDKRQFTLFENGALVVNSSSGLEIAREQGQWQY